MKTTLVKEADITRSWYVVDATDLPAGRLAVKIAMILRGKNKVTYAPHIDDGDFVIVVNADKVKLTGNKEENKIYQKYTGYVDGRKTANAATIRERDPERIITQAVKGMLPNNKLARVQMTRLKVYAGSEHPHEAQSPKPLEL